MGKGPGPQPDDNEVLFTIAATFQNLGESDKKSIEDDLTTLLLSLGSGNVTFDSFQPGSSKVKAYYDFEIDKNDLISKIVKENDIVTVGTKKWVITKIDTTRLIYENELVVITIDDVGLCNCPLTYTINYLTGHTNEEADPNPYEQLGLTVPPTYGARGVDADDYLINDILKTNILHVIIGGEVKGTDTNAFSGCTTLEQIVLASEEYLQLGDYTFDGCESLQEIDMPNTITFFAPGIFAGCKKLLSVNFNNNTNITSIAGETFGECISLEEITIPPNVTSIGEQAFSNCRTLEIVVIPEKVTEINDFAFSECSALESVTFQGEPEVTIGNLTFNACIELKEVNFNDAQVLSIGNNAFANNPKLTEFTIPGTVTEGKLGVGIFQNNTLLTTIRLDNTALLTIPEDTLSEVTAFEGAVPGNFLIKDETQAVVFGQGNGEFSGKTNNDELTTEASSEPGYFRLILVE